MLTLKDVFAELNALKRAGVVKEYAVGGATAVLFYAEPTRTYDLDVFVLLPHAPDSPLVSLGPFYDWAARKGFAASAEHIMIHGVPVQFLPAHNALAEDAVATARTLSYEDVPVRVIAPETLLPTGVESLGVKVFHDMKKGLAGADVIVMLRLQSERMRGALLPSAQEFNKNYGLSADKLSLAKPDAIVMHPGPMNRGVEIDSAVADGPHSVILPQVTFGIAVRMAVMSIIAGN